MPRQPVALPEVQRMDVRQDMRHGSPIRTALEAMVSILANAWKEQLFCTNQQKTKLQDRSLVQNRIRPL